MDEKENADTRHFLGETIMFRIGFGFDIHPLVPGRRLILGGVEIPFSKGLAGHSDADVLCHAVSDALLGAAALGDIGMLFPDTDPRYEGADSLHLLGEVVRKLRAEGYAIGNLDTTVVAEAPRLGPYREAIIRNVSRVLGIPDTRVSLKGKTHEKLDSVGRGEAIAVYAMVLIQSRE